MGYSVVAILAFLTVFSLMNRCADDVAFEQEFLARDLALLESVVLSSPYDLDVEYSLSDPYYAVFNEPCTVGVNDENNPDHFAVIDSCAANTDISTHFGSQVSGNILFEKEGNELGVSKLE
jgi:hypothetical protein